MKDWHEIPEKLAYELTIRNLDLFPEDHQKAITGALENAANDIRDFVINIIRPVYPQLFFDLLQKEIEHKLNDQK